MSKTLLQAIAGHNWIVSGKMLGAMAVEKSVYRSVCGWVGMWVWTNKKDAQKGCANNFYEQK